MIQKINPGHPERRAKPEVEGPLLVLALILTACAPAKSVRCAELQASLTECIGSKVPQLDCTNISDADLERVRTVTRTLSCDVIVTALPVDGDVASAACRLANVGCVAPVTPAPEKRPTRYPVLLVNGIDTSPLFRYSQRIQTTMTELGGHAVFLATLTPYETPRRRAPELWARIKEIREKTGATKVNLICHSLGGLDCRYLVSPHGLTLDLEGAPDLASSVASITTVGTAHRGTRIADVLLGLTPDENRGQLINDFATFAGDWFSEDALTHDVHLREALQALTISQAITFNAEIDDAPGVEYQSFAGVSRPFGEASAEHDARMREVCTTSDGAQGLLGFGKHDFMALTLVPFTDTVGGSTGEPNDGLSAVASARWANFRGCIPADHMEQLGERNIPDVNVENGFDVARFYTNIAGDLSKRGF